MALTFSLCISLYGIVWLSLYFYICQSFGLKPDPVFLKGRIRIRPVSNWNWLRLYRSNRHDELCSGCKKNCFDLLLKIFRKEPKNLYYYIITNPNRLLAKLYRIFWYILFIFVKIKDTICIYLHKKWVKNWFYLVWLWRK